MRSEARCYGSVQGCQNMVGLAHLMPDDGKPFTLIVGWLEMESWVTVVRYSGCHVPLSAMDNKIVGHPADR